jgi:tRNA pseudouridine38-40 synthase
MRTLERLDVRREGERIEIVASARSFLHNQVRSMAGSLEHVGSGKWRVEDLALALLAKDRARCGHVAPPHGLYLVAVDY